MPSRIKVRIFAARDLPVMDQASNLTDAYVEIRLSDLYDEKTEIAHKTLNPVWNQDFRIEVPHDWTLRKHPLEFRVWDRDQFSKDDIIGIVFLDLNNLLLYNDTSEITGWFPIYDTFRGIRGELKFSVKIEFFGQLNSGIDNPAGIVFLSARSLIQQVKLKDIQGFVEELLVDDDPEYNWKDTFRTSRSSNEARQYLLYKLSGKLRRQIGNKVIELGGNAVLGYNVHFDFAETCIVVRGYGTCCTLKALRKVPKHIGESASTTSTIASPGQKLDPNVSEMIDPGVGPSNSQQQGGGVGLNSNSASGLGGSNNQNPIGGGSAGTNPLAANQSIPHLQYKLTDSTDSLNLLDPAVSASPAVQVPTALSGSGAPSGAQKKENFAVLKLHTDIMLMTMHAFPAPVLLRLSGVVTARSIKIIPRVRSEDQNQAIRDSWWSEVRDEIRSHARFLNCQFVIGYTETTSIKDDIMVLTASGTAANLKLPTKKIRETNEERVVDLRGRQKPCSFCHIPYSQDDSPFPMRLVPCGSCGKKLVPEVLLATVDPPPGLAIVGRGQLVEARVCRAKKKLTGEAGAVLVSELIPFLEYDLHKQLIYKMRLLGMNSCFAIRSKLCIGDDHIVGVLHGTAMRVPALPIPEPLRVAGKNTEAAHLHSRLNQISMLNSARMDRAPTEEYPNLHQPHAHDYEEATTAESQGNLSTLLSSIQLAAEIEPTTKTETGDTTAASAAALATQKPSYVVELDDKLDEDLMSLLIEPPMLKDYFMCNTEVLPGVRAGSLRSMQFICLVRSIASPGVDDNPDQVLSQAFSSIYTNLMFKLRNMRPCCLCGVKMDVQIGEDDDVQVVLIAMVLMMTDPAPNSARESLISDESGSASPRGASAAPIAIPNLVPNLATIPTLSTSPDSSSLTSPRKKGISPTSPTRSPPESASKSKKASRRSHGRRGRAQNHHSKHRAPVDSSSDESSSDSSDSSEELSPKLSTSKPGLSSSPRGIAIASPARASNSGTKTPLGSSLTSLSSSPPASSYEDNHGGKALKKKYSSGRVDDDETTTDDDVVVSSRHRHHKRAKSGLGSNTPDDDHHLPPIDEDPSSNKGKSDISPPTAKKAAAKGKSVKKTPSKAMSHHHHKKATDDESSSSSSSSESESSESSDSAGAKVTPSVKTSAPLPVPSSAAKVKQRRRRSKPKQTAPQATPTAKKQSRSRSKDGKSRAAVHSKHDSSSDSSSSSSSSDDELLGASPATQPLMLSEAHLAKQKQMARTKRHHLAHPTRVEITPLSYVAGARLVRFCGRVSLHFVKETHTIREQGGMGAFAYTLLLEAQKVARAHVHNLGANCLTSFQLDQCIFVEKPNKNQGYALINLSGDAMLVEYSEDSHQGHERIVKASTKPREEWF